MYVVVFVWDKMTWKRSLYGSLFLFVLFWCDAWGWRKKKYRPIWDEAIERPRSPSGAHDINKKTADWNHKRKRKGRSPQPGRVVGVINFPN